MSNAGPLHRDHPFSLMAEGLSLVLRTPGAGLEAKARQNPWDKPHKRQGPDQGHHKKMSKSRPSGGVKQASHVETEQGKLKMKNFSGGTTPSKPSKIQRTQWTENKIQQVHEASKEGQRQTLEGRQTTCGSEP